MSIISAKNLTKIYGKGKSEFTALKNISIDIEAAEKVAVIGKSGSGKSTLMHLLALLDTPSEGSVYIDGDDVATMRSRQLDKLRNSEFGFVFQQFFLNANDTVLNNVILPLKISGLSVKERNRRGHAALKAVELEDKAASRANDLSGGQKQRVVIARAIVNNPKVIFADEPTGNLDSKTGAKIENLLFKLNKEQGITLVVVTHDDDLASRFDRQIFMKDGQIQKEIKL